MGIVSDSVPKFSCKQASCKVYLESIVEDIDLFSLPAHRQLPVYKSAVKEAARRVPNEFSFLGHTANASLRLILAASSRAFWLNKVASAKKIIGSTSIGDELLHISGGKVHMKDPVDSKDLFNETHCTHSKLKLVD